MLNDFLVLGQIPGTNIQITFTEMVLILAGYSLARIFIKFLSIQKQEQLQLNLSVKDSRQLSLL